jgi:hypothetical protein
MNILNFVISINKLIDENNEIITDQMHILSTIEKLYATKYHDENLISNYIFDTKPFLNNKDKTLVR